MYGVIRNLAIIGCGTASNWGCISRLGEKTIGEHATVHQSTGKRNRLILPCWVVNELLLELK